MSKKEIAIEQSKYLLEEIFKSGFYRKLKIQENKLNQIKETIKSHFINGESKRYELPGGLVAKFVPNPIYETDEMGLKEFLYDYGVLQEVVSLKLKPTAKDEETKDLIKKLEPFQLPVEFGCNIYLKKLGRTFVDKNKYEFEQLGLNQLSRKHKIEKALLENTEKIYKEHMELIKQKLLSNKIYSIENDYASCKIRKKELKYNTKVLLNRLGPEFLITHGTVEMKKLDKFIIQGYFSSSDIQQFRKVKEMKLKFLIMDAEIERKQAEFYHQKLLLQSQQKRASEEKKQLHLHMA